jgi:hypothetical protein
LKAHNTLLIRNEFNLTDKQMADIMEYIGSHRDEVEQEDQAVLQHAEENRQYWEARHRKRREQIARTPPKLGQEKIRAKIQAVKVRLGME